MLYKLKKIGWYYKNNSLYIYKGNTKICQEIYSDSNYKIFKFIKAMELPKTKSDLRKKLFDLSDNEFNSIFNLFLKEKWIYPIESLIPENLKRINNFVDAFPMVDYPQYVNRLSNINIVVLGLGTGGSYIMEMLVKLGFKNFTIIDGDKVEEENILAQNYDLSDVGEYKSNIIYNKYKKYRQVNIKNLNVFVHSYSELLKYIDIKNTDYIVNCADNFNLGMEIISKVFKDNSHIKIIYGGYTFLMQSSYFINQNNYQKIYKSAMNESKNLKKAYYSIDNMGSIFNGFLSAMVVSNFIFNDLLLNTGKDEFIADFLSNDYNFSNFKDDK